MSGKRSLILRYFPINDDNEAEQFLLIFHQNTVNSNLFKSYDEFINTNSIEKYSILGYINDDFKTKEDVFEFILEYPETQNYAYWKQQVFPLVDIDPENIGFSLIKKTWTNDSPEFIGLHKSERPQKCYIEGTTGFSIYENPLYFYALGLKGVWNENKIPGYIENQEKSTMHQVYLWLKITDYSVLSYIPLFKTCNAVHMHIMKKLVYIMLFSIFLS